MPFLDYASVPLHHGQPLSIRTERELLPTPDERRDGVSAIGVTLAWCCEAKCRKDFVYIRSKYPGGWGPAHKVHDPALKASYRRRCDLARESDIVEASQSHWPYLQVKRVAGA